MVVVVDSAHPWRNTSRVVDCLVLIRIAGHTGYGTDRAVRYLSRTWDILDYC